VFANVQISNRQLVLTSAVLAAGFALVGPNMARAGYVSADCLTRSHQAFFAPPSLAVEAWRLESDGGAAACLDERRTEDRVAKELDRDALDHLARFAKVFHTAWHFSFDSGPGSSSGASSVNGPSSQPAGGLSPFALILIEVVGLLPPQKGVAHPFSVASFLFRPPRAG
jgi:hypothetical protein